jgi:hypothetical protein
MERRDPPPAETIPHPPEADADRLVPEPVTRKVGRVMLRYAVGLAFLGLVAAAILFRSWAVFSIGLVFAVAFVVLITAPLWLAHSTEEADAVHAREQGVSREDLRKP